MARRLSRGQRKAAFLAVAEEKYEEIEDWYDEHPEATFEEIEEITLEKRREMMGEGLRILINGRDSGYQVEGCRCKKCGGRMKYQGENFARTIRGREGRTQLERAYYVCPKCEGETIFPPG